MKGNNGRLLVVATPIGNLEDISLRASRILSGAEVILTEDTRKVKRLLEQFKLEKNPRLISFNKDNEGARIAPVIELIGKGKDVCLVSNAGTPLVSDPGARLVKTCLDKGIKVVPIPGPCALVAALSVSGANLGNFVFWGFLPRKRKRIKRVFLASNKISATKKNPRFFVAYLSPHRFLRTILIFQEIFGEEKKIFVVREITKVYEKIGWFSAG